jgi:hypothetical protein
MEVSKLTLSTQMLQNPTLSSKRKRELRFKALAALIDSKGYGKAISPKELSHALNIPNPGQASLWVRRQAKKGLVVRHELGRNSSFYQIPSKIKTTTLPTEESPAPPPELPKVQQAVEKSLANPNTFAPRSYTFNELEQLAMKFTFYYGAESVPTFLDWLRGK